MGFLDLILKITSKNCSIVINKIELLKSVKKELSGYSHIINPDQEALWLVNHFKNQNELLTQAIKERTLLLKPLAYILGFVDFCGLEILTKPPILIPRVETEEWVENLISLIKASGVKNLKILDLCSGSGCIALALAKSLPESFVVGVDIDFEAVELAMQNKKNNNIDNVDFLIGNMFDPVNGELFDMIVSNPPYIKKTALLQNDVLDWEAHKALFAEDEGLFFYKIIAQESKKFLKKERPKVALPKIVVELDAGAAQETQQIFTQQGIKSELKKDCFDKPRSLLIF